MDFKVENITPEIASSYLLKNNQNRPVSVANLRFLQQQINNNEWAVNTGESIKFNTSGFLVDGQHRLMAIVNTKKTVQLLVARGVGDNAFRVIDTGNKRSYADTLALSGEKNYTALGGVCRLLYQYNIDNELKKANIKPTNNQILEILELYPAIRDSVGFILSKKTCKTLLAAVNGSFCHFLFSQKNQTEANNFFEKFETGANLSQYHPILVLKNRMMKERISQSRLKRRVITALTIKSWNFYRKNKEVKSLKFSQLAPNYDKFPQPI